MLVCTLQLLVCISKCLDVAAMAVGRGTGSWKYLFSARPGCLIKFPASASCVHTANSHSVPLESCSIQLGLGRPVSIGRLAQAAVGQTEEVEFLCLFERQTEIERLQETQRSAAGRYEAEKPGSEWVCVCVYVSLNTSTFKCVLCSSSLCVQACGFALLLLKCPAGRREIAGALKMVTER